MSAHQVISALLDYPDQHGDQVLIALRYKRDSGIAVSVQIDFYLNNRRRLFYRS